MIDVKQIQIPQAGLQRAMWIVEINRQPVRSADDAVRLGRQAKGGKSCSESGGVAAILPARAISP